VRELTAGKTAWRDKLQALTSYVQSGIRYVASKSGSADFSRTMRPIFSGTSTAIVRQGHAAASDAGMKTGIESYYALAQVDRGIVTPEFASAITFNHVIVAIPIPDGESTQTLFATVTDPNSGVCFSSIPPTTYVPLGYLPSPLQENYVSCGPARGRRAGAVASARAGHQSVGAPRETAAQSDGSLSGTVDETRLGSEASDERAKLLGAAGSERAKLLEDFLVAFLAGFQPDAGLGDKSGPRRRLGSAFIIIHADRYAKSAGDLLMVRPRVLGEKSSGDRGRGIAPFPVEFSEASLQTDDFEITLPPGYVVDDAPRPMQADAPFASYKSQIQVDNSKIHYTRTYQVKQVLVPVDQMEQLRRFNRQVATG